MNWARYTGVSARPIVKRSAEALVKEAEKAALAVMMGKPVVAEKAWASPIRIDSSAMVMPTGAAIEWQKVIEKNEEALEKAVLGQRAAPKTVETYALPELREKLEVRYFGAVKRSFGEVGHVRRIVGNLFTVETSRSEDLFDIEDWCSRWFPADTSLLPPLEGMHVIYRDQYQCFHGGVLLGYDVYSNCWSIANDGRGTASMFLHQWLIDAYPDRLRQP